MPIIEPGATLQKLGTGYAFTEGPATDSDGNVYFTDQPNDRIMRWTTDGRIEEWMRPCGRSNGMTFDHDGNLIACADEYNQLWSIAPDKTVTVLIESFERNLLNGPNDVWVRPDNGLYFTDPLYVRDYWQRDPAVKQTGEHVYFLSGDRKTLKAVDTDLIKPNGIVGTPDGQTLFVSDIRAAKTYKYKIEPNGVLTNRALFCRLGSDGMTLDSEGNLYLTGHGVTVFDKTGKQIEHIDIQEKWTGNITFAAKDRQTLFITAGTSVYGLRMQVKGME